MIPLLDLEAATLEFSQLSVTALAVRKTERLCLGCVKLNIKPLASQMWNIYYGYHLDIFYGYYGYFIYYGYHLEHRQTGPVAKSLHFRIKCTAELTLNSLYLLNYCKCVDSFP